MKVLFICRGNVARSQEAAGYLAQLRPDIEVMSAGTEVTIGKPLDPLVLQVAREDRLDLGLAKRQPLTVAMLTEADYIVSFLAAADLPSGVRADEYWLVPDPQASLIAVHRQVRDEIKRRVVQLANGLN